MAQITYIIDGQEHQVPAVAGQPLLTIGLEAGLLIESACGGNGFCTTCMCRVQSGADQLSALNDNEESMGIEEPTRLSCQALYEGEGEVVVEMGE
jgi:ferredoxin